MLGIISLGAYAQNNKQIAKIYDYKSLSNTGAEVDFSQYEGRADMKECLRKNPPLSCQTSKWSSQL